MFQTAIQIFEKQKQKTCSKLKIKNVLVVQYKNE